MLFSIDPCRLLYNHQSPLRALLHWDSFISNEKDWPCNYLKCLFLFLLVENNDQFSARLPVPDTCEQYKKKDQN